MRQRAGFTLIELLVTLVIIAVIAALLIPAVFAARRRAQSMQCLSNLHEIAVAFRLYADAHKGHLPNDDLAHPWHTEIASVAESQETIFRCPADSDEWANLSYDWRDDKVVVPQAKMAGKKIDLVLNSKLLIVFDQDIGWHAAGTINGARLDGSAGTFSETEFEDNLLLNVRTGEPFYK